MTIIASAKRCPRCGDTKPMEAFAVATRRADGRQNWCRTCVSQHQKVNRAAANERLRAWRRRHPEHAGRWQRQVRQQVIEHYSSTEPPSCACCGEDTPEFLVLDHIHGGGTAERRQFGRQLFAHLRRHGFPPGYQVLCANCNTAKAYRGGCPHQRAIEEAV